VLVTRAALATPGAGFATRVLERTAPLDLSAPQAIVRAANPGRVRRRDADRRLADGR